MKYPSSREYKMMLKPAVFAVAPQERGEAVARFWRRLETQLADGEKTVAKQLALSSTREVAFLDTPDRQLYEKLGLILRLRQVQAGSALSDVTLKFRHGDRLQSAAQTFKPRRQFIAAEQAISFEEDVKAVPSARGLGFWALFSRSARAQIEEVTILSDVRRLGRVFARLPVSLTALSAQPLVLVGGLVVLEEVYDGGRFNLADARVEVAVILWFNKADPRAPIAAELSFRFDLHKGRADPRLAAEAWRFFQVLHGLEEADPEGPTKTALIYGAGQP